MDLQLGGKVAFIAGSSRGIGLAIGQAFLREGASVVISGRHAGALQEATAALVKMAEPSRVRAIAGDLTEPAEIQRAFDDITGAFGGIDIVVNNIGSGTARGGWELSREDWQSTLKTNLMGAMALASAALPHLIGRGGGSLTFVTSIAGSEAINAPVTYSAAKAALQSTVKTLARLVGQHGVRINAVAPGNVLAVGGAWEQKLAQHRDRVEAYLRAEVPLQRFGRPEEIADAVVFLSSARASFMTGACVVVDGGQTRAFL